MMSSQIPKEIWTEVIKPMLEKPKITPIDFDYFYIELVNIINKPITSNIIDDYNELYVETFNGSLNIIGYGSTFIYNENLEDNKTKQKQNFKIITEDLKKIPKYKYGILFKGYEFYRVTHLITTTFKEIDDIHNIWDGGDHFDVINHMFLVSTEVGTVLFITLGYD